MEDNRFSTMMPKGINTYDATATAEDIAQGKTAYVAGQKIIGTSQGGGGGDYSVVGRAIDVEAETTIFKGSRIVGRLNDQYVTPNLVSTAHGLANLLVVSDDLSVAICGQSTESASNVVDDGYQYKFYFRNEQTGFYDDVYNVTIENYPSTIKCCAAPVINKDGTLAATTPNLDNDPSSSDGAILLIFEIDKTNKTVSYTYKSLANLKLAVGGSYAETRYMSPTGMVVLNYRSSTLYTYTCGGIVGNLIFGLCWYKIKNKSDDSVVGSVADSPMVIKYENGEISVECYDVPYAKIFTANRTQIGNVRQIDENNFIFCKSSNGTIDGTLYRYNIENKVFYVGNSSGSSIDVHISSNGRYACRVSKNSNGSQYTAYKYEINTADLSFTQVYTHVFSISSPTSNTIYASYINEDGTIIYTSTGFLLDLTRETYKGANAGTTNRVVTETFNDKSFITRTNIQAYTPGSEAEYLISSTSSEDCSTADRIYGIASQDLAVGVRGEARGLFNTF